MTPKMEIIVETAEQGRFPVAFLQLHELKNSLQSILLLWDTNSYYVSAKTNEIMINGGRKLSFSTLGETRIEYRRRNQMTVDGRGSSSTSTSWIIGLTSAAGRELYIEISNDGQEWQWLESL